jgi:hypothetical protein
MTSTISSSVMQASFSTILAPNNPSLPATIPISSVAQSKPGAGTGAGNADGVSVLTGSVTTGTPVVINLTALKFPVGDAITAAYLAGLTIQNTSPSGGTLTYGGGTYPVIAAGVPLGPLDGFMQSFNGNPQIITGGSTNNLTLAASAGTINYYITIFTRST